MPGVVEEDKQKLEEHRLETTDSHSAAGHPKADPREGARPDPDVPRGVPGRRRRPLRLAVSAVLVVLVIGVLVVSSSIAASSVTATSKTKTLKPVLGTAASQPANFWGMNIASDHSAGSNVAATLLETPTKVLVYPAGNLTERTDISTNTIYSPGSKIHAAVTVQDFASYCKSISCTAIVELPMEIDNTTITADEAEYVVNTAGLRPAYFAYGNEPTGWRCFGISWAELAAGHPCNTGGTTASAFATETASAIQAVASALGSKAPPAMCLNEGTGGGWQNDTPWLSALQSNVIDNSSCAAYALHVKPAHSQTATPTLANFYASLTGPQALPADYKNMSKLTDGKPLYLTEVGWTTPKSVYAPVFTGTWAENVLQSALVVQAMQNRIPDMGWFAWNEGSSLHEYNASSFWSIYSTLFPKLGPTWYPTQFTGQRGVFAEATKNGAAWSFLIVSTNISRTFHISLSGSGFPDSGKATLYTVTSKGTVKSTIADLTSGFTLPAQSVVMVTTG